MSGDDLFVLPLEPNLQEATKGMRMGHLQSQLASLAGVPHEQRRSVCNAMQNYPYGTFTRLLPSLTRTSTKLLSLKHERLLTADEHLLAMGLPVLKVRAPFSTLFDPAAFAELEKVQLAGGAMHVQL
eukprot:13139108-Alexandrium_andersonii.AAC.1